MPRKMNQSKTILKHMFSDVYDSQEAMKLALCTQEEVDSYLKEFAECMWHEAYVEVDYSAVTLPQWRNAALMAMKQLISDEQENA